MITVKPTDAVEALITGAVPGQTPTIEVYSPDTADTVYGPTTSNITEPRPGTYQAIVQNPGVLNEYVIRWTIGSAVYEESLVVTDAVGLEDSPDGPYYPVPADVGLLLRARTKDSGGNELGTWTNETRPTFVEVQRLIRMAAQDAMAEVGQNIPEETFEMMRDLIALGAAIQIEVSYFPETTRQSGDRSPYDKLVKQYERKLAAVKSAVTESRAGGEYGAVDEPQMPSSNFEGNEDMIGFETKW